MMKVTSPIMKNGHQNCTTWLKLKMTLESGSGSWRTLLSVFSTCFTTPVCDQMNKPIWNKITMHGTTRAVRSLLVKTISVLIRRARELKASCNCPASAPASMMVRMPGSNLRSLAKATCTGRPASSRSRMLNSEVCSSGSGRPCA